MIWGTSDLANNKSMYMNLNIINYFVLKREWSECVGENVFVAGSVWRDTRSGRRETGRVRTG